ncbi:MAG: BrnT family toxin [Magnetococcales bacterium]|nr:BrnT family toxin [Magnetococcales bacterium]MBF0157819.1 BrnT family toxin [Magnetococcales bacterium]
MELEYDLSKRLTTRKRRGLDFEDAPKVFSSPRRITWTDTRQDYGETREVTMGELDGRLVVLVHTRRGVGVRIISMRKANEREIRWFEQRYEAG